MQQHNQQQHAPLQSDNTPVLATAISVYVEGDRADTPIKVLGQYSHAGAVSVMQTLEEEEKWCAAKWHFYWDDDTDADEDGYSPLEFSNAKELASFSTTDIDWANKEFCKYPGVNNDVRTAAH